MSGLDACQLVLQHTVIGLPDLLQIAGAHSDLPCWPQGALDFEWRASLAIFALNAPFSAFTGINRSITLLEGDGMRMFSTGQIDHALAQVGKSFAFSGDVEVNATLRGGNNL